MILTNVIVTAYCLCHHCCPVRSKGLTASGERPIAGITVAASRSYPLGTKLIYNNHTYTIHDRLARRFDNRVDIYFKSHEEALRFGIKRGQTVTIK